jgi:hypothetical protein
MQAEGQADYADRAAECRARAADWIALAEIWDQLAEAQEAERPPQVKASGVAELPLEPPTQEDPSSVTQVLAELANTLQRTNAHAHHRRDT